MGEEEFEQEPQDSIPSDLSKDIASTKRRRAFSNLRQELTEEELSTPGVQRIILDEMDQLQQRVAELEDFRDRYYGADKERAVLKEKQKTFISVEIINGICLAGGASLMSFSTYFWNDGQKGVGLLLVGVLLIVGGVVAKAVKK